jgi:hypothetical protein
VTPPDARRQPPYTGNQPRPDSPQPKPAIQCRTTDLLFGDLRAAVTESPTLRQVMTTSFCLCGGFLFVWWGCPADRHDLNTEDGLLAAVRDANPASDLFLNVRDVAARYHQIPPNEFARYHLLVSGRPARRRGYPTALGLPAPTLA